MLREDVPAEPCLSLVHVSASQTDVGAGVRRHWSPSRDLERVAASLAPTFGLRKQNGKTKMQKLHEKTL